MKKIACWISMVVFCVAVSASAQDAIPDAIPAPPPPMVPSQPAVAGFDVGNLRISALMGTEPRLLVGMVDIVNSNVFVLREGDMIYGYELSSIDYDAEAVVLNKGEQTLTLRLRGDANATNMFASTAAPVLSAPSTRVKTLEEFLAEHPDAMTASGMKLGDAMNQPPVQGMGEGIESFLKQHPELAGLTNPVPPGSLGSGIEEAMKGMTNVDKDALMKPAEGLGEGIESYLKEHPELGTVDEFRASQQKPKTYEEFLSEHPELNQQNPNQAPTMPSPGMTVPAQ